MNTSAAKRGFHYNKADSELELYVDGTKIASFHATNGCIVEVNGFDLAGQTITTVNASGSACYATMIAAYENGSGAADEGAKYAVCITVGGTDYYIPAFTSVNA